MGVCASSPPSNPGSVKPQIDIAAGEPGTFPAALGSKYTWGKKLGEGMSGDVYLCTEKKTGENLAIKCCPLAGLNDDDKHALREEVRLLKKCKHPNILRHVEDLTTPTKVFIITEIINGGELFDAIVAREKYTEADAQRVIGILLYVLEYLHKNNIVHRDLKPENLMLVNNQLDSPIKLVDFGLATEVPDDYGGITVGAGTPGYLAPECLQVDPNYGKPSDIWAMGVVTYILLCGYPPFYGETDQDLYDNIRSANVEFDNEDWAGVSETAKKFIQCALEPDDRKRPTANQMMQLPWIQQAVAGNADLHKARAKMKQTAAKRRLQSAIRAVMFTKQVERCLVTHDNNGNIGFRSTKKCKK